MPAQEKKAKKRSNKVKMVMVRLDVALYARMVKGIGIRMTETGKVCSVGQYIRECIEAHTPQDN